MNIINTALNQFARACDVTIPDYFNRRFKTGKEDLDCVFGSSGIVPNFTFTLAAAPGTGKTTFLLQTLELLELAGKHTAYISGEETVEQLAYTSNRIGVRNVPLANLTDIDDICELIVLHKFNFVVIDSLPAITSKKRMNKRQLEEYITTKLIKTAKQNEIVIGTILHFTKNGTYKGGTLYPHSCDCNIVMTRNVEDLNLRDIEVTKNRFGNSSQTIFEMTSNGFTFNAVDIENIEQNKSSNKKQTKQDIVLNTLNIPKTIEQIACESRVSGIYLSTLLRQLVNEGKIVKEGRGSNATFVIKS